MNVNYCPTCQSPISPDAPGGFCTACLLRDAEEPVPRSKKTAPSVEQISAAFPELEVLEFIGQGGMGFVYKARQPGLDRIVALKILSPVLGDDPSFEERFLREARTLGQFQHPNIVTVFEHGEEGGFFFLLMEFVDGINLRQAMAAGRFSPEQALDVVPGICDALQAAHSRGICHRDIKPENILLDREGRVKIVDFGIALMAGDSERNFTLTATGGALGSAAYMAPEQHEHPHDVDHRADIYSLGVVLYEMLTGELPLGRFPSPSERVPVNERIDEIVLRTLEKERDLRQQSAAEVKTDISGVGKDLRPQSADEKERTRSKVSRFVMGAVALLVGGGALGGLGALIPSEVIIAIGGAIFAVGFLGCLWTLWEMKSGQIPPKGRGLLIALTVVPMCLAIIAGLFDYSLLWGSFPRQKGGLLVGGIMILVAAFPLFWLALYLGRPLKRQDGQKTSWFKSILLAGGLALLAGGGFYAKIHDGKWPVVGERAGYEIYFPKSLGLTDSELEGYLKEAAGRYHDDYLLEVEDGKVAVTVSCRDQKISGKNFEARNLSEAHLRSFLNRLSWLVPLPQSPGLRSMISPRFERARDRRTAISIRGNLTLLIVTGTLFLCLAGGREIWLWVISGAVFFTVMAVLPIWGGDSNLPRFVTGPPLESLDESKLPKPDFSTPELAVRSFHDAAKLGREQLVRHGSSKALREILDEHDEWAELMGRTGRVMTLGTKMDETRGILMVRYQGTVSGGWLWVVKEEDEWRVDSLNYVTYSRDRTGPFTSGQARRVTNKFVVKPTVTGWILSGPASEKEIRLDGPMEVDVKTKGEYSVLTANVGGHPVFVIVGEGYAGFQKVVTRGGILSGSVPIGGQLDFEVPSGNQATINGRVYDLRQGRMFYKEGRALRQFAKFPKAIASGAALIGLIDDLRSENSPGYVVRELLEAAKNGNLKGFRRRLSRSFLAEIKEGGDDSIIGDFDKVKFSKVSRIGSEDADVVVETRSGKKRHLTFVMIKEEGRWKLQEYGR